MRASNFLTKLSTIIPKSPPITRCHNRDASSQLVVGCFLGTQRDITHPTKRHLYRTKDPKTVYPTPMEEQVPDSKYPS